MGSFLCPKSRRLEGEKSDSLVGEEDKFDKAIFNAKLARDKVKNYIKRMEAQKQKMKDLAKEQVKSNNRERAKIFLARSKAYETQVDSGYGQLSMLEQQIMQIDTMKSEAGAIKALEQGNKILKELQDEISIEKWEKIRDDMDDARENNKELSEFFQRHNIDNEDLDNELNEEIEKLLKQENKIIESSFPDVKEKEKIVEVVEVEVENEEEDTAGPAIDENNNLEANEGVKEKEKDETDLIKERLRKKEAVIREEVKEEEEEENNEIVKDNLNENVFEEMHHEVEKIEEDSNTMNFPQVPEIKHEFTDTVSAISEKTRKSIVSIERDGRKSIKLKGLVKKSIHKKKEEPIHA